MRLCRPLLQQGSEVGINTKIDDTLPGWHIDGLGGRIFELHIALFKEQTPLTQPPGPILAFGNRLLHS